MFIYNEQDAAYNMTTIGYVAAVVVLLIVFVLGISLSIDRDEKNSKVSARQLTFSGMSIALAFLLSYVRIVQMPWGGDITLLSMFFVTLIGYFYGPKVGFIAAFSYSLLQFIQSGGSYILSPLQVCMDYIFAFTALGVSGFFNKKKNGLLIGYLVAVFLRGLFHSIGGYMFWMDYMPENFPQSWAFLYPVMYNYAYIIGEALITVVVILMPPVRKAIDTVTNMARGER